MPKLFMQVTAAILILLLFPLFLVCFVVLFFGSGLPLIFSQKRVGKDGKVFVLYKFRTMVKDAEKKQKQLQMQNEADGPVFKMRDDPRFTKIGKFFSHTGLDELPQLCNIVLGDMAFIGPRPLPVHEVEKLTKTQRLREQVLPGIFSPWVLEGYHKNSFDKWMNSDVTYIKKRSFLYDVQLSVQALAVVCKLFIREMFI